MNKKNKIIDKQSNKNKCSGRGGNFSCRHPKLWSYIKSNVKAFFITGAITFVVTASATTVKILHSRQVRYKNDKSVEQAINELYEKADELGLVAGCKGCIKLEYLESSGSQYINLGIKGESEFKINTKFQSTNVMGSSAIFGFYGGYYNSYYLYSSGNKYFQVGYKNYDNTNLEIKSGIDYTVTNEQNIIHINDYSYSLPEAGSFETTSSLYLFNISGGSYTGLPIKLYYFKLYDNDRLIRDLIPVLDKNKRPCLFDKIEKKYYYNQGTGEFSYNMNLSDFTVLEYIESSGSQYINLGIKGESEFKINTKFQSTNVMGSRAIFGFYGGYYNSYYLYSSGNKYFQVGYKNYDNTNLEIKSGIDYTVTNEQNTIHINDYSYSLPEASSFETTSSLYLFNISGGSYTGLPIKLYYFKLYDNDRLIRDLVPVLDNNNRPCLFDKVEKKCYYNQGTGEFLYG